MVLPSGGKVGPEMRFCMEFNRSRWLTNSKIRLLVGLFLAGLFCIQCTTQTQATRQSEMATFISGKMLGKIDPNLIAKVEKLAKSDHIALLELCQENYRQNYRDYTCTFSKQERLSGQLGQEQEIQVKFLECPYSVAMQWIKNQPSLADRILYVEGKWNNQMLVRPSGFFAFVGPQFRPPDGPEAMQNTLRPVNQFGFWRSTKSLIEIYKQAKSSGHLKQEFGNYVQIDGRNTIVLIRYLPQQDGYPAWKTLVYIDMDYLVPIMIEGYDWNRKLSCRYVFKDIKFNVGLTSDDFLPKANNMIEPKL